MRGYILPPFEQMATPTSEEINAKARELYAKLRSSEERTLVLEVYNEVKPHAAVLSQNAKAIFADISDEDVNPTNELTTDYVRSKLLGVLELMIGPEPAPSPARRARRGMTQGGKKRSTISKKFNKCVKSVRKTVKARRGSDKESAAIAICTTSVLHPRKRTIKRYRKGRLVTQRRR
jgi:hypothetical protein